MTDNTGTVEGTEPPTPLMNAPQLGEATTGEETTGEETTTANMSPAQKIKWLATYAKTHRLLNPKAEGNLLFPGASDGWAQEGATTRARWTRYRDGAFTHPEFLTTRYRKDDQMLDITENQNVWLCRLTIDMGEITVFAYQTRSRACQCIIQASTGAESLLYAEDTPRLGGVRQILRRDDTTPAPLELLSGIPSLIKD